MPQSDIFNPQRTFIDQPSCPKCGSPMWLARIEPRWIRVSRRQRNAFSSLCSCGSPVNRATMRWPPPWCCLPRISNATRRKAGVMILGSDLHWPMGLSTWCVILPPAPVSEGMPPTPPAVEQAAAKMHRDDAEHFCKFAGFGRMQAQFLIREIEQAASSGPINEWTMPIFFSERPENLGLLAASWLRAGRENQNEGQHHQARQEFIPS